MLVTIDGPAGSGKSSTAKKVAHQLGIQYLDSGALYRTIAFLRMNDDSDESTFFDKLKDTKVEFFYKDEFFKVFVDGTDISTSIRSIEVSNHVSEVAANPAFRSIVNEWMKESIQHAEFIADGRDLGTAVFPEAELKFYMIADLETRAMRRFNELQAMGKDVSLKAVKENIKARDEQDSNRENDPLAQPEDAILIDTSTLRFDQQVEVICGHIRPLL
ncbi:MAG: (d)CMP kinase [Bacteroidota bacterium]